MNKKRLDEFIERSLPTLNLFDEMYITIYNHIAKGQKNKGIPVNRNNVNTHKIKKEKKQYDELIYHKNATIDSQLKKMGFTVSNILLNQRNTVSPIILNGHTTSNHFNNTNIYNLFRLYYPFIHYDILCKGSQTLGQMFYDFGIAIRKAFKECLIKSLRLYFGNECNIRLYKLWYNGTNNYVSKCMPLIGTTVYARRNYKSNKQIYNNPKSTTDLRPHLIYFSPYTNHILCPTCDNNRAYSDIMFDEIYEEVDSNSVQSINAAIHKNMYNVNINVSQRYYHRNIAHKTDIKYLYCSTDEYVPILFNICNLFNNLVIEIENIGCIMYDESGNKPIALNSIEHIASINSYMRKLISKEMNRVHSQEKKSLYERNADVITEWNSFIMTPLKSWLTTISDKIYDLMIEYIKKHDIDSISNDILIDKIFITSYKYTKHVEIVLTGSHPFTIWLQINCKSCIHNNKIETLTPMVIGSFTVKYNKEGLFSRFNTTSTLNMTLLNDMIDMRSNVHHVLHSLVGFTTSSDMATNNVNHTRSILERNKRCVKIIYDAINYALKTLKSDKDLENRLIVEYNNIIDSLRAHKDYRNYMNEFERIASMKRKLYNQTKKTVIKDIFNGITLESCNSLENFISQLCYYKDNIIHYEKMDQFKGLPST